ncbi:DDE-type integrase/transposase/recombinase [Diaminobutyricimonas sp. LJ205]|uniref:DDE-type integrase/transposase/recombinase n=1 Tax=Diaminobutyricimonas sp. LJ205 TaxID=2683590 RepID=UPI0012F495A0|nr:DDE-type integrase/transposase/recombinase [Diaminobutyricimonas sp. LJ205]
MPTLNTAEVIQLTDGDHQYVDRRDNIVRLRRLADNQYIDMDTAELSRRVVGLTPALPKPLHLYAEVTDKQVDAGNTWAIHLRELTTGIHPITNERRPEYDIDKRTQDERIAEKVLELQRANIKASRRTVMRKLQKFRQLGDVGVIDGRALRDHGTLGNLDPRVRDALCVSIERQTNRSTGTQSRIIAEAKGELRHRFGADEADAMLPHDSTLYRHLTALTAGKYTTGSAKTRRSTANRPRRTMTTQTEILPGAQMQIDSTVLDVLVRTSNPEKPARPTLTIMMDVATRSIVAYTMRLKAAKGVDHVTLLAQALTPAQNRPDKSLFRQALQAANSQCSLMSPEERAALDRQRPYIHPRRIMMDNGKDFLSEVFKAATRKYGVSTVLSAPHTPTDKGIVERTFGSINTLFSQYRPGYVGRSPEHRGFKVEKENLLDLHTLFELFDDWVVRDWQNRPHSSLRDQRNPSIKLSPNQAFAQAAAVTGNLHIPIAADDYIDLLPTKYVRIQSVGVQVNSLKYDSVEIHPLRGTKSNLTAHKGKWAVKYDPYNRQTVWVAGPDNTWIACPLRDMELMAQPAGFDDEPDNPSVASERDDVAVVNAVTNGTPMHNPAAATSESDEPTAADIPIVRITNIDIEESPYAY